MALGAWAPFLLKASLDDIVGSPHDAKQFTSVMLPQFEEQAVHAGAKYLELPIMRRPARRGETNLNSPAIRARNVPLDIPAIFKGAQDVSYTRIGYAATPSKLTGRKGSFGYNKDMEDGKRAASSRVHLKAGAHTVHTRSFIAQTPRKLVKLSLSKSFSFHETSFQ